MNQSLMKSAHLREAMERIKDENYKPSSKKYACELCKDSGVIVITDDGEEIPALDAVGMYYKYTKPCKCVLEKQLQESLKRTGLDIEEYQSKNFETFKRDTEEANKMYKLAQDFLKDEHATGIGFFGKSGTGKTHICIAICNELLKKGVIHKYFNYRRDIQVLIACRFNEETYNKKLSEWMNVNVLYIDDFLKLAKNKDGTYNVQELQISYDIINTRYINKKKTILSSELSVSDIKNVDEAIGSRIFEMIDPYGIKLTGANRRFIREH